MSSGVIWSQGVKDKMLEWLDATLIDGVGATEGAMALQLSRRGATGAGAKFVALADTRLFAEDGREILQGSNEPGLIAAGGALLPAGYYKDPEKTAKTFRIVDGKRYAFIGDWGQWNTDGTLQLLGRGSACINTGGEKVYPEEVEHVIVAHPGIADCLVIGVADERFGQKVVALVVPRNGTRGAWCGVDRIRARKDGGLQAAAPVRGGRRNSATAERQGGLQGGARARRAAAAVVDDGQLANDDGEPARTADGQAVGAAGRLG